jgi:hypothetical protein
MSNRNCDSSGRYFDTNYMQLFKRGTSYKPAIEESNVDRLRSGREQPNVPFQPQKLLGYSLKLPRLAAPSDKVDVPI